MVRRRCREGREGEGQERRRFCVSWRPALPAPPARSFPTGFPMSVVMKFGGTSVADSDAIKQLTSIVLRHIQAEKQGSRPPVVVVSAFSKVTDGLLEVARLIEGG